MFQFKRNYHKLYFKISVKTIERKETCDRINYTIAKRKDAGNKKTQPKVKL